MYIDLKNQNLKSTSIGRKRKPSIIRENWLFSELSMISEFNEKKNFWGSITDQ